MRTILLFLALATANAFATDAQSSFDQKNYADAARQQEEQLASAPSAEGYYNLGLAKEKAGDTAQAVLNYERALLLDPGLRSARNALSELASKYTILLPRHTWTSDVNAVVHPDVLAFTGSLLFWAGAFGILFASRLKRNRGAFIAAASVAVVIGTAAQFAGWLSDGRLAMTRPAIVTAKDGAEVLTEPANNSTSVVTLPSGAPVGVVSPRGSWTFVDLNGGARGWVQTERLTPVVPGETL